MDVRDFILKNKVPGGSPEFKSKVLRVAKMAFFDKGSVWIKLVKNTDVDMLNALLIESSFELNTCYILFLCCMCSANSIARPV